MSTPPRPPDQERLSGPAVRVGALVPLSPPGWVDAGRHLLAGLELATGETNDAGGIGGRPLELVVRDTAADPERAVAAVEELAQLGVAALAGEYHSVAARAVAVRADALGVPFLCSSAVIDELTDHPTDWVARLAPVQSRGWAVYADFLLAAGHRQIALTTQPSVYWTSGGRILRAHLHARGGAVLELDADALHPTAIRDALVDARVSAALLLVGQPEPATSLVRAVRRDPRLADVLLGAPAGQPELSSWTSLGGDGVGIPFLRYRPDKLGPLGTRVELALRRRLGESPSFVALEGYDTGAVLAEVFRTSGPDRAAISETWSRVAVPGTRGPIRFTRGSDSPVWQWDSAPVQVADRDPERPGRFRVLLQARAHPTMTPRGL